MSEIQKSKADPSYEPKIRIAIITARNAPAHKRMVTTLRSWGIAVDETFFLGGIDKHRVLEEFAPHISLMTSGFTSTPRRVLFPPFMFLSEFATSPIQTPRR